MKTREERYNELYSSGLVDSIKSLFNYRDDISEDYYVLMADYIDSMDELKEEMLINPTEIAKRLPECVKAIQEDNLRGIYGRTDDNVITMEESLSYEDKKLFFFHELTHALQTYKENGMEQCGFANEHNGMFLTEGATQYTAEMLYNASNGTNLQHREQPRTVRGASDRKPNSPLSEYQYNGNILELLAKSMDLPLPQVLALAYKKNGRETLKEIYESMEGNQGKFDELMDNLEQIYSIDKLTIFGNGQQLDTPALLNIRMTDGTIFQGNMSTYRQLMDKTERELVASYIENHDTDFILQHYSEIERLLTTPELKASFLATIQQLSQEMPQQRRTIDSNEDRQTDETVPPMPEIQTEMPEGYSINEYGEIIRPDREEHQQTDNQLSFSQKIAQFLQKNNILMNLSFVKSFVHKKLDVLPPAEKERSEQASETHTEENKSTVNSTREDFINQLTNFGEFRKSPQIARLANPQKIEEMKREAKKYDRRKDGDER